MKRIINIEIQHGYNDIGQAIEIAYITFENFEVKKTITIVESDNRNNLKY